MILVLYRQKEWDTQKLTRIISLPADPNEWYQFHSVQSTIQLRHQRDHLDNPVTMNLIRLYHEVEANL